MRSAAMPEPIRDDASHEFAEILEPILSRRLGADGRIVRLERRPSPYRTSFGLEELDLHLETGEVVKLLRKDLGAHALLESAREVKPRFLHDPLREIEVYRRILFHRPHLGAPMLFGSMVDPGRARYWLILERVRGVELYQVGEFEAWKRVAAWLASFHAELAPLADPYLASSARLIRCDADFLRLWMERARSFVAVRAAALRPTERRGFLRLASRYERVVDRIAGLPVTVIHGEFYASNILVAGGGAQLRVAPVDWEMAALGPGLIDLAALVAGKWSDAQRRELALTYNAALPGSDSDPSAVADFLEQLEYCRLSLAVQWLGWSPEWEPPAEHAQDWLGEALQIAERLDL